MRTRFHIVVLACLLLAGCAGLQDPPEVRCSIGVHDISFQVPEGWDHLNHGLEHRFHFELSQISMADYGPVTPSGYLREVRYGFELFRNGQVEDAREHLKRLNLRWLFSDAGMWKKFKRSWWTALDGGRSDNVTGYDVEIAYDELLKTVEILAPPDLAAIVENAMPSLDSSPHREIAEQHPVEIGGHPGLRVETWDRLSHDHRKSYLFVLNEDNLLVIRMEIGPYTGMKPVFEALVESVRIYSGSSTS